MVPDYRELSECIHLNKAFSERGIYVGRNLTHVALINFVK
jgi:hypothetical protein